MHDHMDMTWAPMASLMSPDRKIFCLLVSEKDSTWSTG